MPSPATIPEFVGLVERSGVLEAGRLAAYLDRLRGGPGVPAEPPRLAGLLVRDGLLTHFQAEQFLQGRWKRFSIGKYKVLERIGAGGMGQVFLCEHKLMRRRVAVKVLPTAKAEEESALKRFYREARAVAALDHPNIVRAYDIDQDERLHFLVMEYVDGRSLQEIVKGHGPMAVAPACHYVSQAAVGIQYASDAAGLVHRDIKPGNILVDRQGTVKILDMGLARFFHDTEDNLTQDDQVLGTADYLAPEQAVESHSVDVRADVYSLGATFYFLLTGQPPFPDGSTTQKLVAHLRKNPRPVRELRPEVPAGVAAVLAKMMAKDPDGRYQAPAEVAAALAPWTAEPLDPPPAAWMPHLSPAAQPASDVKGPGSDSLSSGQRTPSPSSMYGPATPRPAGSTEAVVPTPRPKPSRKSAPGRRAAPSSLAPDTPPPKSSGVVKLSRPESNGDTPATVSWESLTAETQAPPPAAQPRLRPVVVVAGGGLVVALGALLTWALWPPSSAPERAAATGLAAVPPRIPVVSAAEPPVALSPTQRVQPSAVPQPPAAPAALTPDAARQRPVGEVCTVVFQVLSTGGEYHLFLNSKANFRAEDNFTVRIPREHLAQFGGEREQVRQKYEGRWVRATGRLTAGDQSRVGPARRPQVSLAVESPDNLILLDRPPN